MKLKPLGDRIIVKPIKEEEVTASGIILPDTAEKEQKSEGVIIALGEGERIKELGLKEGDKVIFGKYAGEEFKEGDEEYKILSVAKEEDKSDVFAIFTQ
ncbi:co-chaperone GroES [Patescibacteria group bacterium]|nr:co-chaperone GroES [Patescibacteria group bacterium]MBU1075112.1 co-chaperone GroES [Patescibacteria group bacterium]MBU1952191.1 co-chaperone GroES [Patescibacteria group bacterium]MBU2229227.1 co-chaperone GroES [Patescibacteria group bacterium]MBU2235720.1 co-chaperone GroES [Patescibacteria group bacterium]